MKAFELLGRTAVSSRRRDLGGLSVGAPEAVDCDGAHGWRRFAKSSALERAWGPRLESPWATWHRPTLFASLDSLATVGPEPVPGLAAADAAGAAAPAWARRDRAILLDLPGEFAVAWAAFLARRADYVTISTFNNWPHKMGAVPLQAALGALLYFTPWVEPVVDGPPCFILDSRRFGVVTPRPGEFDNRYYLTEADIPTAAQLKRHGIQQVVYVRPLVADAAPPNPELDDMNGVLHELRKGIGLELAYVRLDAWGATEAREFAPAIRKTPFTATKDPAFAGFRRSSAGGFGELVPEPSSTGAG